MTTNQATKEEQILRKQQILEELKKVEQELQEKAQQQLNAHSDLEQQQQMQAKLKQPMVSPPSVPAQPGAVAALTGAPGVNKPEWVCIKFKKEMTVLLKSENIFIRQVRVKY